MNHLGALYPVFIFLIETAQSTVFRLTKIFKIYIKPILTYTETAWGPLISHTNWNKKSRLFWILHWNMYVLVVTSFYTWWPRIRSTELLPVVHKRCVTGSSVEVCEPTSVALSFEQSEHQHLPVNSMLGIGAHEPLIQREDK